MDDKDLLDIYTDYLISSYGLTRGTGLSRLLAGAIRHDRIQRFLSSPTKGGADFWKIVKPYGRQVQAADGVMMGDDSLSEKPHTDENESLCWHYDHTSGQTLKGITFITALYQVNGVALPVNYHLVAKTEGYRDPKTTPQKRRATVTKNEIYQQGLRQAADNQIPGRQVVNAGWFASAAKMRFVKHDLKRDFVMPLKTNGTVALSLAAKKQGQSVRVDELVLEADTTMTIYLAGGDFPLHRVKQVFTNGDGSVGILQLVTTNLELTYDGITTSQGQRWKVEPYHKSLKQNAALSQSPPKIVTTQSTPIFASLWAFSKLEMLKVPTKTNHFALKSKLQLRALRTAFVTLRQLQPVRLAA